MLSNLNIVFLSKILHYISLRYSLGNSAVIEFLDGEIKVYKETEYVLTNAPSYKLAFRKYQGVPVLYLVL
ncbi:MAG: linear amide C-N hydrolase [Francisella endosymbiont of Hyalomma asiaticum]